MRRHFAARSRNSFAEAMEAPSSSLPVIRHSKQPGVAKGSAEHREFGQRHFGAISSLTFAMLKY
jgi:hypothetical protein